MAETVLLSLATPAHVRHPATAHRGGQKQEKGQIRYSGSGPTSPEISQYSIAKTDSTGENSRFLTALPLRHTLRKEEQMATRRVVRVTTRPVPVTVKITVTTTTRRK
jgi:hypothetical protein